MHRAGGHSPPPAGSPPAQPLAEAPRATPFLAKIATLNAVCAVIGNPSGINARRQPLNEIDSDYFP